MASPWTAPLRRSLSPALALAVALAAPGVARACGAMVFQEHEGRSGGMGRQEIFVDFGPAKTTMVVGAGFVDTSGELAFVLPLAAPPDSVADADLALFVALDDGTAPRIAIDDASSGGGGLCAGDTRDGGALGGGEVIVYGRGQTETYTYVIVGGESGTDLATWLGDNGFATPADFGAALQGYADDGWVFLAAKVSADEPAGDLAPLELALPTQPADAFAIPFGIAAHSLPPDRPLSLTLYLSGGAPVMPANYEAAPIDEVELQAVSPDASNYADLYAAASAGGRLVVDHRQSGWEPAHLRAWYDEADWQGPVHEGLVVDLEWLDGFADRLGAGPRHLARLRGELGVNDLKDMVLETVSPAEVASSHVVTFREGACRVGGRAQDALWILLPLLGVRRGTRRRG